VHLAAATTGDQREQQRRERLFDSLAHGCYLNRSVARWSVHLPCETDVHLASEPDVHLSSLSDHFPSKG
jgi:hypothetical protein